MWCLFTNFQSMVVWSWELLISYFSCVCLIKLYTIIFSTLNGQCHVHIFFKLDLLHWPFRSSIVMYNYHCSWHDYFPKFQACYATKVLTNENKVVVISTYNFNYDQFIGDMNIKAFSVDQWKMLFVITLQ